MTQQITYELDLTFRCNYTTLPQRYIYLLYVYTCISIFILCVQSAKVYLFYTTYLLKFDGTSVVFHI